MKFWKQSPLLMILIAIGVLLTVVAVLFRSSVYQNQTVNLLKEPILSIVFTGMSEGIYPWSRKEVKEAMAPGDSSDEVSGSLEDSLETQGDELTEESVEEILPQEEEPSMAPMPSPEEETVQIPVYGENRMAPLRESTNEEYMKHISADIYGDAGVLRAAEYEFTPVEENYFDDVLFIGDSRTVGLYDYTDLKEHATFLCKTSLTIYKVLEENFKGQGTVEEVLHQKEFHKIYLMLGINELGRGTTEDFMKQYTEVVDTLHELAPDAKIIVQAILRVSGSKNRSDAIFNNQNINARNNAIATLADNYYVYYLDVNEVTSDENGDLAEENTHDQIHLLGAKCEIWKEFLLAHGIVNES